jgi:hypothetical protein
MYAISNKIRQFAGYGQHVKPPPFRPADHPAWFRLAAEAIAAADVAVWAYCLMPHHVHPIAAPRERRSLAAAVAMTHVRDTPQINQREGWTGHLWRGRFASVPVDGGNYPVDVPRRGNYSNGRQAGANCDGHFPVGAS